MLPLPSTELNRCKVLVVIAHPDDETFGCGGTIAKLSRLGATVTALLVTKRADPRGQRHWPALTTAFTSACERLGAIATIPDSIPLETDIPTCPHLLNELIIPWIDDADIVLTHWRDDAHFVHRAVSHSVEIATRPFRRRRNVYLFEVPTSTDQGYLNSFAPNMYSILNKSDAIAKADCARFYDMEMCIGRRPSDLTLRMKQRGTEIGVDHAEAFVVARQFC
jgi:LmbE family N-acetylglucosaminyl deacetylase